MSSVDRRPPVLLLLITMLSMVLTIEGFRFFECEEVDQCNLKHTELLSATDKCKVLGEVQQCLDALGIHCYTNVVYIYLKGAVVDGNETYNCTMADATPEPTSPSDECEPKLMSPDDSNININDVMIPEINPSESLSNVLCSQHYYPSLRHCSLFSYSHLRPFGVDDIQTCSLPGRWYLLNHPDVTIEVNGVSDGIKPSSTKIDQVNITLYNFKCTAGDSISYTASLNDDGLPDTFTSEDYLKVKLLDVVDFHINSDRSVATIIAPWLNLTIIVTKQDDNLGVVLRMPLNLLNNADGLCSNECPTHSVMESEEDEFCYHDKNTAILSCTQNAGLLQASSSLPKFFINACQYDVLHSMSYSVLSFIKTIAKQYPLLPNVGPTVPDPPTQPGFGTAIVYPVHRTTTPLPTLTPSSASINDHSGSSTEERIVTTSSSFVTQSAQNAGPSATTSIAVKSTPGNRGNELPLPTNLSLELASSSNTLQPNRLLMIFLAGAISSLFLLFRS